MGYYLIDVLITLKIISVILLVYSAFYLMFSQVDKSYKANVNEYKDFATIFIITFLLTVFIPTHETLIKLLL